MGALVGGVEFHEQPVLTPLHCCMVYGERTMMKVLCLGPLGSGFWSWKQVEIQGIHPVCYFPELPLGWAVFAGDLGVGLFGICKQDLGQSKGDCSQGSMV